MTGSLSNLAIALSASPEIALAIKATFAVASGLVAARLAHHARASIRHMILAATFAVLMALPLGGLALPALVIDVPVAAARVESTPAPASAPTAPGALPSARGATDRAASMPLPSYKTVIRTVWLLGVLVVAGSFAVAVWQLSRMRRTSLPWIEGRRIAGDLGAEVGVPRSIDVLLHEDISAPLTCGLRHPAIILPMDVSDWNDLELRRAFVHELEHVRRRDWWIHLAARGVCALYWFHPLVWMAYRQLCHEAERACDDAAIAGEDRAQYADQLVSLARRMAARPAQPALAMANRSDLSRRVTAVLDTRLPRGRAGLLRSLMVGAIAAAVAGSLAPVRIAGAVVGPAPAGRTADTQRHRGGIDRLDQALVEAADDGDLEGVRKLIAAGADVNAAVDGDGSPLIAAAREGHLELVAFLLDHGANPNLGVDGDGSPVIMAAEHGHMPIVQLLLDRGADPNLGVEGDGSALIMASREGRLAIVQLLLDRGAQIELVVPGDENALIQASGAGRLDVVTFLVSRGANVNARVWADGGRNGSQGEWRTPLNMAERGRHRDVAAFLRSAGAVE